MGGGSLTGTAWPLGPHGLGKFHVATVHDGPRPPSPDSLSGVFACRCPFWSWCSVEPQRHTKGGCRRASRHTRQCGSVGPGWAKSKRGGAPRNQCLYSRARAGRGRGQQVRGSRDARPEAWSRRLRRRRDPGRQPRWTRCRRQQMIGSCQIAGRGRDALGDTSFLPRTRERRTICVSDARQATLSRRPEASDVEVCLPLWRR